jgi:hypothetical protein
MPEMTMNQRHDKNHLHGAPIDKGSSSLTCKLSFTILSHKKRVLLIWKILPMPFANKVSLEGMLLRLLKLGRDPNSLERGNYEKSILCALLVSWIVGVVFSTPQTFAAAKEKKKGENCIWPGPFPFGPNCHAGEFSRGAAIKLWLQEVNAKGGIYVKQYGKRLPVELQVRRQERR